VKIRLATSTLAHIRYRHAGHGGKDRKNGREWRAQLVAQNRKKLILGGISRQSGAVKLRVLKANGNLHRNESENPLRALGENGPSIVREPSKPVFSCS
jgi:hypothetical protein